MGINTVWDNPEKTVVRFIYEDTWTWDEYHDCHTQANTMMDSVTHSVITIVDMRRTNFTPPNAMRHIRHSISENRKHNNTNIAIFLGANDFIQALNSAAQRIFLDVRAFSMFYYADTLEEARALADKHLHKPHKDDFSDTQPIR